MRRLTLILAIMCVLWPAAQAAPGQVLTLRQPVELRARAGANHAVVATAPEGSELVILRDGRDWVGVSFDGRRYYAPTVALVAATPSQAPGPDPTCDYGYPYSGSGLFFARPLAQLRHSEPLGFLLGYHQFYPC